MTDLPARGSLISLRARREEVIELLCNSYAADLLEEDEFETRLDLVHRATDIAVLNEIVRDVEVAETPAATAIAVLPEAHVVGGKRAVTTRNVVAIMGGVSRKGAWRAPRKLRVFTLMGGAELDFREVALPPGPTEVKVFTLMGGTEIIVPPGLAVECEGIAIMGGFETVDRAPREASPNESVLRVSGFALMGGVDIQTRLPGESARQARRRRKRETKAREKANRLLPG